MPIYDSQGSYTSQPTAGYAGMIATQVPATTLTAINEDANLAGGVAVGQGTADRGVTAGAAAFRGIVVANQATGTAPYGSQAAVPVMTKGQVVVMAKTAVTTDNAVTYDNTGAIGADLSTTILQARFMTAADAGSLVVVHLG